MRKREPGQIAGTLRVAIAVLVRRLRQLKTEGQLSMPEAAALALLDREGPTTSGALAKHEQITPQSMGVTLSALASRGLVARRLDPNDRRRTVISLTRAGRETLARRRDASTELLARSLTANFSAAELEQLRAAATLMERLARTL